MCKTSTVMASGKFQMSPLMPILIPATRYIAQWRMRVAPALVGVGLGIAGVCQQRRRIIFAVLGLVFNAIILLILGAGSLAFVDGRTRFALATALWIAAVVLVTLSHGLRPQDGSRPADYPGNRYLISAQWSRSTRRPMLKA